MAHQYWSSGVSLPLRTEARDTCGFVKVFRDATHLRTRIGFLENMLRRKVAAENEQHLFVGTIAHELRNPPAPLKTSLHLLNAQADPAGKGMPSLKIRSVGFTSSNALWKTWWT